jgi:SAM-dependent methyltransferase
MSSALERSLARRGPHTSLGTSTDGLSDFLCCPRCRGELDLVSQCCRSCRAPFSRCAQQWRFRETWSEEQPARSDWLNAIKERVKNYNGALYSAAIDCVGPVYTGLTLRDYFPEGLPQGLLLNLGAGVSTLAPEIINVDLAPYPNLHLVCSLESLPLRDGSVDGIVCVAVLEHVRSPAEVVREMHRVLRPGGQAACFVPFMQGEHASPYDFQRYTPAGLAELFSQFSVLETRGVGPTSALVWILQEWLALFFSLGSTRLYRMLVPATWLLSPLKYLDRFMNHHPAARVIATGFLIRVVKRT